MLGQRPAYLMACSVLGALAVVAIAPDPAWARSAVLTAWQLNTAANQVEVTLNGPVKPRYFLVAQPTRIVVDLPGTKVGKVEAKQGADGPIRQVRVSQFQKQRTRIVIELAPDVVLAAGQVNLQQVGQRWIIRPLIAQSQPVAQPVSPPSSPGLAQSSPGLPETPVPVVAMPPAVTNATSSPATFSVPVPTLATPTLSTLPPAVKPGQPTKVSVPPLNPSPVTAPRSAGVPRTATTSSPTTAVFSSLPSLSVTTTEPVTAEPTMLPAAAAITSRPVTVRVPPLNSSGNRNNSAKPTVAVPLPPSVSIAPSTGTTPPGIPAPSQLRRQVKIPVIQFGQPLPLAGSSPLLPPTEPGAILLPIENPK